MSAEKIVKLNNLSVYEDILTYLGELRMHSEKTAINYETHIRQFFKVMKNKEIEYLTTEDLKIKRNDVLKYRQILQDQEGYKNNTINQKLAAVKSLYDNLKANDYEVNPSVFKVKKLKENVDSYGHLSQTEADRISYWVLENESTKPYLKHCLIQFATRTSFRLDEILRIEWDDFKLKDGYCEVTCIGKGQKERTTSFSMTLYNKLMKLKEENKKYKNSESTNKVFVVSKDAINDMMKRIREGMGLEDRNIVFHSFRGIAIDKLVSEEGLEAAIEYSGHSNYDVMIKHYVNLKKDLSKSPGIRMDEEIDWSFVDGLSLENLKEFIKQGDYKLYTDLKKFAENL